MDSSVAGGGRTLTVKRRFAYPAEQVYAAWLDPASAGRWLFATSKGEMARIEIDPRVGGSFLFVDRRDGEDVEHVGEYVELDPPHRLAFYFSVPAYSPVRTLVTVSIEPADEGCELTLTHSGVDSEWAERTTQGWTTILASLEDSLGQPRFGRGSAVRVERRFAAPREMVWQAWTDPAQVAQWWSPERWTIQECKMDVRPGGRIHMVMQGPEPFGAHSMGGIFHEVDPPGRLVFTTRAFGSEESGWQMEVHNTVTLREVDGGTLVVLTARVTRATPEMAQPLSYMELGWEQSFGKLAGILEKHTKEQHNV